MRILYIQYTNPGGYPPLQHSSTMLARMGWDVLFLGTGAQGANGLEFPSHPRVRVKRMRFCKPGWKQKAHYTLFNCWILLWALWWRPRWVYASDSLSCPGAALLSFVPFVRLLYHEHDSPSVKHGRNGSIFDQFVINMRDTVARRAALCILPNERRAEMFREVTRTDQAVVQVWNCPSTADIVDATPQVAHDKLIVFFHGSIVPARLPVTVIEALAMVHNQVVLHIAGYETVGHPDYVQQLMDRAQHLGIGHRVMFLGSFPRRATLLQNCRMATVGLALMPLESDDMNEQFMAGASNKPFDYLASGLALLVSDLAEWTKMFVEPGYGLACDPRDATSIARQLLWFVDNPAETRLMGLRGRQRVIQDWNYENAFSPVVQTLLFRYDGATNRTSSL